MYAALGLEWIGCDDEKMLAVFAPDCARHISKRPWVAEITGHDPSYGLARRFVRPRTDYVAANGRGTRGVMLWFFLDDGKFYEVRYFVSWKRDERYFCRAVNGRVERIQREDVEQWLSQHQVA